MKKEKFKIKPKAQKRRRTWLIKPQARVHSEEGYQRSKEKEAATRLLEESRESEGRVDEGDQKRQPRQGSG